MDKPKNAITLPSGAWVLLKDPEELLSEDLDKAMADMPAPDRDRPFPFATQLTYQVMLVMIEDWYVPYLKDPKALPIAKPEQLRRLKIRDRRALEKVIEPAREILFPKAPTDDDDQLEDPGSPTMPASA